MQGNVLGCEKGVRRETRIYSMCIVLVVFSRRARIGRKTQEGRIEYADFA